MFGGPCFEEEWDTLHSARYITMIRSIWLVARRRLAGWLTPTPDTFSKASWNGGRQGELKFEGKNERLALSVGSVMSSRWGGKTHLRSQSLEFLLDESLNFPLQCGWCVRLGWKEHTHGNPTGLRNTWRGISGNEGRRRVLANGPLLIRRVGMIAKWLNLLLITITIAVKPSEALWATISTTMVLVL